MDIPEHEVEVELRGSAVCRDRVVFGGRNGNIVIRSSTPEVLKGWRLVWLNGQRIGSTAAEVEAALRAAKRQSRYIVRFCTDGQVCPRRRLQRPDVKRRSIDAPPPVNTQVRATGSDLSSAVPSLGVSLVEQTQVEETTRGAVAAELDSSLFGDLGPTTLKGIEEIPIPVLERTSSLRCPSIIYSEVRFLGSGAYGRAFLVRRLRDGHHFVAKTCDIAGMDAVRRQACLDEIGLLRRLRHDCIAEYVDFLWTSEERECFWLVLKYYSGGDVQHRIEKCRERAEKLDGIRIQTWLTQLSLALDHVHALRIVHNDVKGSNLFITGADNIVLGDFGVSEQLEPDSPSSISRAGSPAFMAPERWNGGGGTFASDMWSVGVVAYELCALRRPFVSHNLPSLIYKVSCEDPEPLPEDLCDSHLWELIPRLLHKEPEYRPRAEDILKHTYFRSCVELLGSFHKYLEDTADALHRAREELTAAERAMKRLLVEDTESETEETAPDEDPDDVLTLKATSGSWSSPPKEAPAELQCSDSWGCAEIFDDNILATSDGQTC
eukprot:TRINITY_DN38070_c0_g1_i1.p1 TRINITY_DN38070_c0_g1~~TRINITY_DN38070_c0_g1_i1.p1  ORF type:complete len:549 (-),score=47.45 TRINITY_DN38070_c0_g1_i1:204-1850(-)